MTAQIIYWAWIIGFWILLFIPSKVKSKVLNIVKIMWLSTCPFVSFLLIFLGEAFLGIGLLFIFALYVAFSFLLEKKWKATKEAYTIDKDGFIKLYEGTIEEIPDYLKEMLSKIDTKIEAEEEEKDDKKIYFYGM